MRDLADVKGRVALVTGAGQGIGRTVALRLAEHGASAVVVNDLFPDRAERVAAEIRGLGTNALPVIADVTDPQAVKAAAETVSNQLGPVHILVNNAGVLPGVGTQAVRRFEETGPEDWEPWIRLNLYGVMLVTRAFLPGMLEKGWGRIVTVISDASRVGHAGLAAYAAAKAGAAGFMRSLAIEVGKQGVTANCVSLGYVMTETFAGGASQEMLDRAVRRYPVGRFGEPDDVAGAILFLVSDAAAWITG